MSDSIRTRTVSIANGQSLSAATSYLEGMVPVGVIVPGANWTTAALTFQGSLDGTTWLNCQSDTGEYVTGQLAAGEACSLDHYVFLPWRYLKVRSGTSANAVAQAGGDSVTLILRAL